MDNHLNFLAFRRVHYPTRFQNDKDLFISKRVTLGENWETYIGCGDEGSSYNAENIPRRFDQVNDQKYHIVSTDTPEFASNLTSAVKLNVSRKRKRDKEMLREVAMNPNAPWFGNIVKHTAANISTITFNWILIF